nr:hypothetical protein [Tanacetum cinerariifolium]
MEMKDTVSLCLVSKDQELQRLQENAQLSKEGCMTGLKALQSNFTSLSDDLKDNAPVATFKPILHQQEIQQLLNEKKLQTQEVQSNTVQDLNVDSVVMKNTCFRKENGNSETAFNNHQMIAKYFVEYTRIKVKHFRETLLQHMGKVKKSVAKRTCHQRQYDRRVNKRQMQTQESKVDTGQQHTEQPKIITEGRIDQYTEQCQVKCHMLDSSFDNKTTEFSKHSLESENICLKKTNEHLNKENKTLKRHYKDLYDSIKLTRAKIIEQTTSLITQNANMKAKIQETVFAIDALKNEIRKSNGNSVDTKFAKTSVLGKPILQPLRNQSVIRCPNMFKSKRPKISKPRFASSVDVEKDLSKPVTQHYLPKGKESSFVKPTHMIASSSYRNNFKNMPRFSSNDMVHNHYLDEVRTNTQERDKNSKTSVMPSVGFQSTANDRKPKPRSTNYSIRILHEEVVTPLIEPAIKGFAAAPAVLKPERLKVDKTRLIFGVTSSIHIESPTSPTKSLLDVGSRRISIVTVNITLMFWHNHEDNA